jgi:predicted nucleic acid-binding protein
MALVFDTGPLYAAMDRSDRDHDACSELFATGETRIVPAPVVVELAWLAFRRGLQAAFAEFLRDVEEGAITVADLTRSDYTRVSRLCAQYADLPLDVVDAAVLAVVERLAEPRLATLDHRHFRVVRPRHVPTLTLLPDLAP